MANDGRPVPPPSLQVYNSYAVDPEYAEDFTTAWCSFAGFLVLLAVPRLIRAVRSGRLLSSLLGIREDLNGTSDYDSLSPLEEKLSNQATAKTSHSKLRGWLTAVGALTLYSPSIVKLDIGQIFVIASYLATLIVCITRKSQLIMNGNRAGFLAVAQLPLVFLLASKNSILATLLGRGWEKLNFLHRWSGRAIFLSVTLHGALWINNHLKNSPQSLKKPKEVYGLSAFSVLGFMVLVSLRPLRHMFYQVFFITHIIGFVTFFILVCYHTPYAEPWIFPALAFYGADLFVRMLRTRVQDATLTASDNQMTLINIENSHRGWVAGQHIRLRVFFSGRVFESHPLSICNAPADVSTITSTRGNILLGARSVGDWTRALNALALSTDEEEGITKSDGERCCTPVPGPKRVMVMIDGPYGGVSFDLGRYERILLFAGGAGITFTLGILDDLIGRIVRLKRRGGERTRTIEFAWCIKSYGCIEWFAPQLTEIATAAQQDSSINLHMKFFVTCFCNPEAAPAIPNSEVTITKPSIHDLLQPILNADVPLTGGLGVASCGPESLVDETRNAVARIKPSKVTSIGGVALHTELYCL